MFVWWWAFVCVALGADLPLERMTIEVHVAGPVADVIVEQTFRNPSDGFIDATYLFPLHEGAAVDDMTMILGDRQISAVVAERGAARAIYEEAAAEGRAAALTEQERPNLFTQSVANIPPGEAIVVRMHLVQPVPRRDGAYELVLPLAVTPRFSAPSVEDADRIEAPGLLEPGTHAGQPVLVPADTGLRVDIAVDVELGMGFEALGSPSHEIEVNRWKTGASVTAHDVRPDRDFVLRWRIGPDEPAVAALRQRGYVLVQLEAPEAPPRDEIVARELIWVLDTSCSMSGDRFETVRQAMQAAFDGMDARDSFMVVGFSDRAVAMDGRPLPATPENIGRGRRFVADLGTGGGTHMLAGLQTALALPRDPLRERYVCFLTDGAIGAERELLAAIEDQAGDARIYPFGIGAAPNSFLLTEMARAGRGVVAWTRPGDAPEAAVRQFLDRIDRPVLADIAVDWGDWEVVSTYPERIPDLAAGQPMRVIARVRAEGSGAIEVTGRLAGEPYARSVRIVAAGDIEGHAFGSSWARERVGHLERQLYWGEIPEVVDEIVATAIEYRLVTSYTSFVATDRVVNPSGVRDEVQQPLSLPGDLVASAVDAGSHGDMLTKEFLDRIPSGRTYQTAVQMAAGRVGGGGGNPNMGGGAYNENVYRLDGIDISSPLPEIRLESPGSAVALTVVGGWSDGARGRFSIGGALGGDVHARGALQLDPKGVRAGFGLGYELQDGLWVLGDAWNHAGLHGRAAVMARLFRKVTLDLGADLGPGWKLRPTGTLQGSAGSPALSLVGAVALRDPWLADPDAFALRGGVRVGIGNLDLTATAAPSWNLRSGERQPITAELAIRFVP